MSVLLTRGTRLSQPQGPVEVDWADPLARGLVSSINPAFNDALRIGSPSFGTGERGRSLAGNGSSLLYKNTPSFGSAATILYVGNFLTGAGFACAIGTSGAGNQLFGFQGGSSGVSFPRALIRTTNGGGISSVEVSGAATDTSYTSIDVWAATYDGTNQLRIFRNGLDAVGGRANTAASGAMSSMDNYAIGGLNRGTDSFAVSGQVEFLGLAWNRALSDAEIASISANPWQLFKPVQRRVWFNASAGGGGTAYTLTADVGSYSLSGIDAGVIASRRLTADIGSYGLTGQDATLTYTPASGAYTLTADVGTYNLSGVDAGTVAARRVTADVGSYGLTGQDAAFVLDRRLTADYGAYSITGQDATLTATGAIAYTLAAEYGLYSIAGQNAELIAPSGIVDTHDGFWNREYRKMFEYGKKKPTIAEVVDEVVKQDPIAAIEAVKPAVAAKIKLPDNNSELVAKIQQSANLQKAIASALIAKAQAQKAIDDDEQDIEDILMLI